MSLQGVTFGLFAVLFAMLPFTPAAVAAGKCESLATIVLPDTTITLAQSVPPGALSVAEIGDSAQQQIATFKQLPAFCRVAATLKPSKDSDIKIEVWMPLENWNNKFQAVGNGGWAGSIRYPALAEALLRGYSTSGTDTGHTGSESDASFALGHPEKVIDLGYRSEHEMTVKAKALIHAFYGNAPKFSYWNGCSTGGRQGLREAQSYPQDYDGIIAGDPANPVTRLAAWGTYIGREMLKDPANSIPSSKYPMIHRAVINACDAIDGLKDRLIDDPTRCKFDFASLQCKGEDSASCLTSAQIESARKITSAAIHPTTGEVIYPGLPLGSELGWAGKTGGTEPLPLNTGEFKYVVFKDANWDWRTFNLETDVALADKIDNGTMNAINPDLSAFQKHGGKLLMYHGGSDQAVPPLSTINYYKSVLDKMGSGAKTAEWLRLFMVPGMGHCRGGDGPNTFDAVTALEDWVEKGRAPEKIIASHSSDGKVDRTRPLCPYPQVAAYQGNGSIDEAANFVCKMQ